MIYLAISVQYASVTDGQTDTRKELSQHVGPTCCDNSFRVVGIHRYLHSSAAVKLHSHHGALFTDAFTRWQHYLNTRPFSILIDH